jgi:hypothetical protein
MTQLVRHPFWSAVPLPTEIACPLARRGVRWGVDPLGFRHVIDGLVCWPDCTTCAGDVTYLADCPCVGFRVDVGTRGRVVPDATCHDCGGTGRKR